MNAYPATNFLSDYLVAALPGDIRLVTAQLPELAPEILYPCLAGLRVDVRGTGLDIYLTEEYVGEDCENGHYLLGICPAGQPEQLECLPLLPVKHLVTLLRAACPTPAYLIVGLPDFTGGSPHVELAADRESARQAMRDYTLSLIEEGDPTAAVLDFDERGDGNMVARADYTAYAIPWPPQETFSAPVAAKAAALPPAGVEIPGDISELLTDRILSTTDFPVPQTLGEWLYWILDEAAIMADGLRDFRVTGARDHVQQCVATWYRVAADLFAAGYRAEPPGDVDLYP